METAFKSIMTDRCIALCQAHKTPLLQPTAEKRGG
jgi:hypothetical protein